VASPIRLSETKVAAPRPVPTLGQHTDEVLRASGYADQEIGTLRGDGVIQ
jgi:formyl-CoA transferase